MTGHCVNFSCLRMEVSCVKPQAISYIQSMDIQKGRTIAQAVSRWLPPRRPGVDPGTGQVGSVVDKVALGQVFSDCSTITLTYHLGLVQ
jgi:hypothetical protein